jgi:L-seryl-tRNA(Ser) seleniumtransferase
MVGFTESVPVADLAGLGVPVVVDIGSGLLDAGTPWLPGGPPPWLVHEPAARQTLGDGATLVTFSGDKLLGGPQAGVVAGSIHAVAACARHPLSRALRPGVLVLGALQHTALAYLRRDGGSIPFWRMATASLDDLGSRAAAVAASSGSEVVHCASVAGGGSLPGLEIPSVGVALTGDATGALRVCDPPVIGRVENGRTICDVRSVDPEDDHALAAAIRSVRREP